MTFYRRNLPHLQRDNKPHFITFVTYRRWRLPSWARDIVLKSCLHDHEVMHTLHAAVVMPDHVHLILIPLIDESQKSLHTLAEIMGSIKSASAHLINRRLGRHGSVWQEESFDRALRSSEKLEEKIAYVLANPVRKSLVVEAREYRWIWPKA